MRFVSRREFLASASAAGSFLLACGDDAGAGGFGGEGGALDVPTCTDAFSDGELLGVIPFIDDEERPLGVPLGSGLDGRLFTDLSALTPDTLITPSELFYVRTRYPDLLDANAPWIVSVSGLVDSPLDLALDDLLELAVGQGTHLMECSGNSAGGGFGLMSAADWSGIPVADVLSRVAVRREATRVLISGFDQHSMPSANNHSQPGASWVFTFGQLEGAFLATEMNGEPLLPDHGAPLRLLVPGWYGCTCIKWVDSIRLVDDSEPATSQMVEFASRTHQNGEPVLAADYAPATMDQAAMPVRVEKWRIGSRIVYRSIGVVWGGYEPTDGFSIRYGTEPWSPVSLCQPRSDNATWSLFSHVWRPTSRGTYSIRMRVDDPSIVTKRLDSDYYLRTVEVDEV